MDEHRELAIIVRLQQGDTVIFVFPDDRRKDFLKRVVALPGDTVKIRKNILFINDRPLAQHPAPQSGPKDLRPSVGHRMVFEQSTMASYRIQINEQRPDNMPKLSIPHGHCFVMGDNRSDSLDSRQFGAVPLSDIKGRLDFIIWPAGSWARFGRPILDDQSE